MGCDDYDLELLRDQIISIHASRMGCDLGRAYVLPFYNKFQSTHPVWDAT